MRLAEAGLQSKCGFFLKELTMHKTKPQVYFSFPLQIFLLTLLCFLLLAPPAIYAQESGGEAVAAAQAATVTPNDINEIAKELWCPLCSGVRLDACELKACEQMRDMIAEQLAEGQDKQEIKDYFIAQYGPQVLGEPPLEGFNWLAWILPFVALIGGGVFVWRSTRRMVSSSTEETTPTTQAIPGDEYSQRLEEELKRYE